MKLSYRLTTVLLALSLMGLTACQTVQAQAPPAQAQVPPTATTSEVMQRVLNVTGSSKVSIPTTITQVSLGVEVSGETAQEVQAEVARRSQAVVDLLKSRQVQKLQTTGIRLNPRYDYNNDQRNLVGYTGVNLVSFEVETEQAGNILDAAVEAGATRIDNVSFVATESAIAQAQQRAIRQAVQDAQQQADAALDALDFRAREVISISINNAQPPQPVFRQAANFAAAESVQDSTPVEGGEQEVNARVTLQIRY
jgi:uncharacterized protein YggE